MKNPLVDKFTDNKADVNQGTDAPSILLAKKTAPSCYAVAGALADLIIAAGGDVSAEALARANADSAEATLRSNADIAEVSARNTAIGNEVIARNGAISSAIGTEISNRNGAISAAVGTEVTNRNTAIAEALNAHWLSDSNLNNLKTAGIWVADTTCTNTPYNFFTPLPSPAISAYVVVMRLASTSVKQIWYDWGRGDAGRTFERDYNDSNSTWTTWTDNNSLYSSYFNGDLDTLKIPGMYMLPNTATNMPVATYGFLSVISSSNVSDVKQIWYEQNPAATSLRAFQRCINITNVWGTWIELGGSGAKVFTQTINGYWQLPQASTVTGKSATFVIVNSAATSVFINAFAGDNIMGVGPCLQATSSESVRTITLLAGTNYWALTGGVHTWTHVSAPGGSIYTPGVIL